jgi:hypothetical protein
MSYFNLFGRPNGNTYCNIDKETPTYKCERNRKSPNRKSRSDRRQVLPNGLGSSGGGLIVFVRRAFARSREALLAGFPSQAWSQAKVQAM